MFKINRDVNNLAIVQDKSLLLDMICNINSYLKNLGNL